MTEIQINWPASSIQGSPRYETGKQWLLATKLLLLLSSFLVQVFSPCQHFLVKHDKIIIVVLYVFINFEVFILFKPCNMTLICNDHEGMQDLRIVF